MTINQAAKFHLGQVVATPAAIEAMQESGQDAAFFLDRHVTGDWGEELCKSDRQLNDDALVHGDRLLSAYKTLRGQEIWIITEADRSVTTLLLPDDY